MKLTISLLLSLFSLSSFSFKLSPMTASLELGKDKNKIFYIQNDSNKPEAIQVSLTTRKITTQGKEENEEVEDDFLIFPDQLILAPGERKGIKVSYVGPKNKDTLKQEEAFRLIAEQLPLDLEKKKGEKANIKILLKYRAAFYLRPAKGNPRVALVRNEVLVKNGKVSFSVENSGEIHKVLTNTKLVLIEGANEVQLPEDMGKGFYGENVLAGSRRRFQLPVPKRFTKQAKVKLKLIEGVIK